MAVSDRSRQCVAACAAVLLLILAACGDDGDGLADRQAAVAERGAEVMPFDLDATTHTFTDTDDGGIQTVVADDPADSDQIELVREHLREERDKFARGDFEDPAAIHGHDMDGVAALAAGYRDITVTHTDLPDGARLTYSTSRADLVDAIHAWFARQVADHGPHAETG
ncbi:MAG: aspartate carbamoyltransferase [Microthrixaceae bacterium]